MEEELKNNVKFFYNKLSPKRLETFIPSKTLGEELRLQRNYYDLVKVSKTTTMNKTNRLTNFLNLIDNKKLLDIVNNPYLLEEYLKNNFNNAEDIGCGSSARISELENENNPKLEVFNRDNYFTSYYLLFTLYGFMDFNSLLKLLYRYEVSYKYSSTKVLKLPKGYKAEFNIFKKNSGGYSLYSLIRPYLSNLNIHEKVEISLRVGEPSYFIQEFLDNKIVTITYKTAKNLVELIGIKLSKGFNVEDLLKSFGMLEDSTVEEMRKLEQYMTELDYDIYQEQNNLIPVKFNYIYKEEDVEAFSFLGDLKEMVGEINHNLQKFVSASCSVYDIASILTAYKVLTTLKDMSTNIEEASKLLSLPLNEDINNILNYYKNNILKEYYDKPYNITLLEDIEPSENTEIESLKVCIPKLVVDVKANADKYKFKDYFKGIYYK